jgi:hypothetical protein
MMGIQSPDKMINDKNMAKAAQIRFARSQRLSLGGTDGEAIPFR